MRQGLDWPGLMRAGISAMRLHPRDFWTLTPAELQLMLGKNAGLSPLGRADLERLQAAFPDRETGDDKWRDKTVSRN
ncbi:MAG: rcc01693 family protein [Arenibacterium sp.]